MDPIRILMADDHPMFRDGLRALLSSVSNIVLIGEATTGDEVVDQAAQLQPDIILMDIQMPGLDGIEATRRILNTSPHIRILILTMFEDHDSILAAMRAGARGYLLKGARQDEILRAIQTVDDGGAIFNAPIAQRLLNYLGTSHWKARSNIFPELTDRELEILNLVAAGHNNAQIAQRLFLSPKTVRNHVSNIFHKLEVADRIQAVLQAKKAG